MLRTLLIFAAALGIAACAAPTKTAAPAPAPAAEPAPPTPQPKPVLKELIPSNWVATDIAGQPVVGDKPPTLAFNDAGRVAGNASCNGFNGPVKVEGDKLAIGPLVSTQMACTEAALNLQEVAYLDALGKAASYTIAEDGVLTITSSDGVGPIRFRRE